MRVVHATMQLHAGCCKVPRPVGRSRVGAAPALQARFPQLVDVCLLLCVRCGCRICTLAKVRNDHQSNRRLHHIKGHGAAYMTRPSIPMRPKSIRINPKALSKGGK